MERQDYETVDSRLVLVPESLYVGFMGRHEHRKNGQERALWRAQQMVASIGVVASPSQGVSYYQRDGYYAKR